MPPRDRLEPANLCRHRRRHPPRRLRLAQASRLCPARCQAVASRVRAPGAARSTVDTASCRTFGQGAQIAAVRGWLAARARSAFAESRRTRHLPRSASVSEKFGARYFPLTTRALSSLSDGDAVLAHLASLEDAFGNRNRVAISSRGGPGRGVSPAFD